MKTLALITIIGGFACSAHAAPPQQVIDSCLNTESARQAAYTDLSPGSFTVDEDEVRKRTAKTIDYRGRSLGIWESTQSEDFGLIYNDILIPNREIVQIGVAGPTAFIPFEAQWGAVRYQRSSYLCITFNFAGLGQSGSFQNVRATYLVEMNKRRPRFYFTTGDVRNIKER